MPGLTYTLKADASGMEKGIQTAQQRVDAFRKKNAKQPLLRFEGDLKAERNIVGLVTDLSKAQSGAELLSAGLGRVGDIFQNSLATGVVFALGSAFFDMANEANKAFNTMKVGANEAAMAMSKSAILGNIDDVTAGLKTYDDALKNINAEEKRQQSVFGSLATRFGSWTGGPGVQEAANENEKEKSRLAFERAKLMVRVGELADKDLQRAKLIAENDDEGLKKLEDEAALEDKIAKIRMTSLTPEAKEKLIQAARELAASKKLGEERQERVKIEEESQRKETQLREQGAKAFEAAQKKISDALEKRLSLEDKIKAAKERVKIAQDELKRARGTAGEEMAQAKVAEAQGGLIDAREAMIERIRGGSTKAAEAARQERRDARERARAERILDKRQAIKDLDARARGEKPAEIIIKKGAEKDPIKEAVDKSNGILTQIEKAQNALLKKLTVA